MEDANVFADLVSRILQVCRDTFGSQFNGYYEGDPQQIPKNNIPCVIVEVLQSDISVANAPTSFDGYTDQISIRLVLNKEDDIGKEDTIDLTERKLRRYVQARDPATGKYLKGTLMYALRNDITFQEIAYNTEVQINYDLNPRPDMVVTSEAQVVITATGKIQRY